MQTYRDLAKRIEAMTEEQKDMTPTALVGNDFIPLNSLSIAEETDILSEGHPYMFLY